MLLEVLIALLIFMVGSLGIVGLQAAMTKAQTGSKSRADAAFLAQKLIGTIWVDRTNMAAYDSATCASNPRCSEWLAEVSRALPGGAADVGVAVQPVEPDGTRTATVTVTIRWALPSEEQRRYMTTSTVSSKNPNPT